MYFRLKEKAKMLWLKDRNQNKLDNLNNVRPEAYRHFRNKNKEYIKAKNLLT
jgi:hypothetical protein